MHDYGGERVCPVSLTHPPFQNMTTPSAESMEAPAQAKPASRWEDFVDIFYAPTSVYERRQNQSPWPTIWIITLILFVVTVLTFNALSPMIENELRETAMKAMAKNPQMTQDIVDTQVKFGLVARHWGGVFFPIGALIIGLFVWIVGKFVGAKESYTGALSIITYAAVLAILAQIIVGAQALVMDVSALTSPDQLSLSAARFVDKATTSPMLYALYKQLDVFGIWSLVVMAIGMRVIGKVDKNRAIAFAVIWWVLGTLLLGAVGMWQAR
jgi:membrane protein, antimicrobial resistance system